MVTLQQRLDRLAPWGVVLAMLATLALGFGSGADILLQQFASVSDGSPPTAILRFFEELPYDYFFPLYYCAVLGIMLTFLRRHWWLAGCATFLLWLPAERAAYAILNVQPALFHFTTKVRGETVGLGPFLLLCPPPVVAALLFFLIRAVALVILHLIYQRAQRQSVRENNF